jgi:hypothetical protein
MSRDEKQRNAYKRYWRNKRNYEQRVSRLREMGDAAGRSWYLMHKAQDEMEKV